MTMTIEQTQRYLRRSYHQALRDMVWDCKRVKQALRRAGVRARVSPVCPATPYHIDPYYHHNGVRVALLEH